MRLTVRRAGGFFPPPFFRSRVCEAHVPAEPYPSQAYPRVPRSHGHRGWPQGSLESPPQGTLASDGLDLQEVVLDPTPFASARPAMTALVTSARVGLTFPKTDRLLRRFEFLAAQKEGRRVHTTHFVLILRDRHDGGGPRLGVTASRKAGNSVRRHRVRRSVREVFRLHREVFPPAHDLVVLLRENVPALDYATVRDEIVSALTKPRKRGPPPSPLASESPNGPHSRGRPSRGPERT